MNSPQVQTLEFDYKSANRMVKTQKSLGNDVEWIGWDTIVFYNPNEFARTKPEGVFRNGEWAYANRFTVDSDGIWRIDSRNIKRPRRSRSR